MVGLCEECEEEIDERRLSFATLRDAVRRLRKPIMIEAQPVSQEPDRLSLAAVRPPCLTRWRSF